MKGKGQNIANWNWQVYDRAQGILPQEEAKADFELNEEIEKVDLQLGLSRKPADSRVSYRSKQNISEQYTQKAGKRVEALSSPNAKGGKQLQ